jgi:hypothetical protein
VKEIKAQKELKMKKEGWGGRNRYERNLSC